MRDGGPAFPAQVNVTHDFEQGKDYAYTETGMTLRDWFAGQALQGLLAHGPHEMLISKLNSLGDPQRSYRIIVETATHQAYAHADSMLAEREKVPGA